MEQPTIHGERAVLSERNMLEAIGDALLQIKAEDHLTWADIGAILGVSDDSAAKYATGMASMTVTTFHRGEREWGGRFAGPVKRLVLNSRPGTVCGHMALAHMMSATSAIHMAHRDGTLLKRELQQNRSTLEVARDQLDELLRLAGEA